MVCCPTWRQTGSRGRSSRKYAVTLAGAVVSRTRAVSAIDLVEKWLEQAKRNRIRHPHWKAAVKLDSARYNTATWAKRGKLLCQTRDTIEASVVWSCYGGYYFSPTQSIDFDSMLAVLPKTSIDRMICKAAMIVAASECVASPGHTAQPFQPNRTAGPYLREAWLRDPFFHARRALELLCPLHGRTKGQIKVGDAVRIAAQLTEGDLVFVDPPYSDVHYSRFYHVLETIARGSCGDVSGTGRYPPPSERPASAFSRKTESSCALVTLLRALADRKCTVAFAFPAGTCSNGLSGDKVIEVAAQWFKIDNYSVQSRFSTMGGNNLHRDARMKSRELILLMRPKRASKYAKKR